MPKVLKKNQSSSRKSKEQEKPFFNKKIYIGNDRVLKGNKRLIDEEGEFFGNKMSLVTKDSAAILPEQLRLSKKQMRLDIDNISGEVTCAPSIWNRLRNAAVGSASGAVPGAATGAAVGAGVGALAGGVGALPGAGAGAVAGAVAGAIGGGLSGLFDDPCANLGDVAKRGAISGAIDGALGGAGAAAKAGALATKAKAAAEAEAKASAAAAKAAAESRSASSANAVRLNQQLTSQEIAGGHAFDKHVIERAEFPEVSTRQQFAEHIENVINNPTASKQLNNGRSVFWDDATGTVVIRNPKAADGGTAFRPTQGKSYFDGLK